MSRPGIARTLAASLALAAATVQVTPANASDSSQWRIECNRDTHPDGEIVFRVVRRGGTPIDATVRIAEGTSDEAVARPTSN